MQAALAGLTWPFSGAGIINQDSSAQCTRKANRTRIGDSASVQAATRVNDTNLIISFPPAAAIKFGMDPSPGQAAADVAKARRTKKRATTKPNVTWRYRRAQVGLSSNLVCVQ